MQGNFEFEESLDNLSSFYKTSFYKNRTRFQHYLIQQRFPFEEEMTQGSSAKPLTTNGDVFGDIFGYLYECFCSDGDVQDIERAIREIKSLIAHIRENQKKKELLDDCLSKLYKLGKTATEGKMRYRSNSYGARMPA